MNMFDVIPMTIGTLFVLTALLRDRAFRGGRG